MNINPQAVKCDECGKVFSYGAVKIKSAKITLNNTIVDLVYFTCPKCDKIHKVSIQDARYYDLKKDLDRTKKRIQKNKGSRNEELARVLNDMVNKKLERLRNHVDLVNKVFAGTFVFEASENNPKKRIIKYLP